MTPLDTALAALRELRIRLRPRPGLFGICSHCAHADDFLDAYPDGPVGVRCAVIDGDWTAPVSRYEDCPNFLAAKVPYGP